ncbi:aminotransferase class I/II-fold pyridoxal phosphate-dependent enzyme [Embleya sp. NPDC008237]|uniref:aminotransferase class I/II-fold pyridoxal phosphate-dependent enzyme n=1 Tax=Embleya sp. NPDC008237 TaxID=3363978 RepID=UPI0036E7CC82
MAVYRELRAGLPADCAQIGYGYNLHPAAGATHRFLHHALRACADGGRLHEYGTAADGHDRALAATLAGAYLGLELDPDQVLFTTGATEGIGLVTRFLAACDAGLILPSPCYYAFEQTPRRHGGTILGRYRHDGTLHPTGEKATHTALVEILPNGVTGTLHTPPRVDADFRIVDIVFLAGGRAPTRHAVTDRARATLAGRLDDTAVLMTPSKDLCVPGIRPGLLLSTHAPLIDAARDDVFDRSATTSPLAGQVVLLYLSVLLLAEARHTGGNPAFATRHRWLQERYAHHRVPTVPSERTCRAIVDHLDAMSTHFAHAFDLAIRHTEGLLLIDPEQRPVAGYSLLPRVLVDDTDTPEAVVRWVNTIGRRHALKLNPSYLFGGDRDSWHALDPGPPRIRVNLSVAHPDLLHTLALLRAARDGATHPRRDVPR